MERKVDDRNFEHNDIFLIECADDDAEWILVMSKNAELREKDLTDDETRLFYATKQKEWHKMTNAKKAIQPLTVEQSRLIWAVRNDQIIPLKYVLRWKHEDLETEAKAGSARRDAMIQT